VTRTPIVHRVRAVNTAPESENKIHDDRVAAEYGFRGGLVPGVTVYGYMTAPVIAIAPDWLDRGTMQVRFLEPFYDGDEVIAKAEPQDDGSIIVTAERSDGTVCAKGTAAFQPQHEPAHELYDEAALPAPDQRPVPSPENLIPGAALGTITAPLVSDDPAKLLQCSNDILVRNFKLGPWIHVASEITNWRRAHAGDEISARARIHDHFERKGHEFVALDVMLLGNGREIIQTVRHTAIYRLRSS
jgi:acyl dehydratase